MQRYAFNLAFDKLWADIQGLNKRIDAEKPWMLLKSSPEEASRCLAGIVKDLLVINQRLSIFIPNTAEKIATIFSATEIKHPEPALFPRG